ncbi:MAG: hypothetical protein A2Y34_17945 [Spirochaetes bacterium GWC1_27_15]|nr:MAG: hypothetical protein A2Y34_17945 [Spirochaetes bacterium GWC1_27_15]
MLFCEVLKKININYEVIANNSNIDVSDIVLSSKEANDKTIFASIKGFKTDGHKFINDCYLKGIKNFLIEDDSFITDDMKKDSTIIKVTDTREGLGLISNVLNDFSYNKLKMIGITGTKGKTTVSTLTYKFLKNKFSTSFFSTVKNIVGGIETPSERTTMEANKLQGLLKKSLQQKEECSIVEVSSHAVTLKRVIGINWDIGIFTTFSRDHLDLYGTMEKYFDAKLDFFRSLNDSTKKNKIAIINMDDPKGRDVLEVLNESVKKIKVGSFKDCDYFIKKYSSTNDGLEIEIETNKNNFKLKTPMRGVFNVNNISLAFACADLLGVDFSFIQNELSNCYGVEGRFEIVITKPFTVIVDYAHTPDSLEKILKEARIISKNRVISIFGCTGDRDKEKRPIMGEIASLNSDFTYITNDDTYTEDPNDIATSVESGFKTKNYKIILDRKEAITDALTYAKEGDVIIVAGMGHEKFQILNNVSVPYNDKDTILEVYKNINIITQI